MKCYKCDTELMNDWNYCPNCKRRIKKNKKVNEDEFVNCQEIGKCHKCSCVLSDNWNFCPVCGTSAEFYSDKPHISLPVIATSTEVVTGVNDHDQSISKIEEIVVQNDDVEQIEESEVPMEEKEKVVLYNDEVLCPKCGGIVLESHLFCSVCGNPMKQENNVNANNSSAIGQGTVYVTSSTNEPVVNQSNTDKGYVTWVWLSYLGGPCGLLLSFISGLFFIGGSLLSIGSAIYAKAKYPNVAIVKFTFWFILIVYTLFTLFVLAVIFIIAATCASCIDELG